MEHITDDEESANILTREIQSEDCNPILILYIHKVLWILLKINAYLQYKLNPNYKRISNTYTQ